MRGFTAAVLLISSAIAGAELWSLAPISDPATPDVLNKTWAQKPLDRFVLAKIEAADQPPPPPATRRTIARRAYLDLHGLPPTTEQLERFVFDNRPDAWARLVDDLLSSPRYGERWGRHWLDVARYADSNGMDEDIAHPAAFRYRNYVIDSINEDKPFDQFIVEQLAGDLLPADSLGQKRTQTVAAGFLSVGPKMLACDDPDKMRRDIVDEQLDTTGRAFMGMTIGCARCHDHKFDPISIKDYYSMAGVFMSTQTLTKYSVVAELNGHDLSDPEHKTRRAHIAELEKQRGAESTPEEDKHQLATEIASLRKDLPEPFAVLAPKDYPAEDMRVHLRGDYLTLGELVPRGVLPVVAPSAPMPKEQSGRVELARWIASAENPLTARVIATRVWRWHFGRGIVPTPDNFGALGEAPTHPALLDHLAQRLIESKWSLKALHREIMLSATYQQSSLAAPALIESDPENKLFARWAARRVESEVVRDSILFMSGRLDLENPGPELVVRSNKYVDRKKLTEYATATCRTVYLPVLRSSGYDGQNAFDFPDPAMLDGNRRTSTVAPQALYLTNSAMVHASSDALAGLLPEAPVPERVSWLIKHLYGRSATIAERERGAKFVNEYGEGAWAAFARALFASNEFLYIE